LQPTEVVFVFLAIGNNDDEGAPDRIAAKIIPLGQRFFPSEAAFPIKHVASTLVRYALAHPNAVPVGWAPRVLVSAGVPRVKVWELLNGMYESQVPPFHEQGAVQALSADLAVFLTDWTEEAARPQSAAAREFPVSRVDAAVDQYLAELEPSRNEVRAQYEAIKRQLRRYW
jgi:nuclear pore complex protein Nup155